MLDSLSAVFTVMVPVFVIAGLGYFWQRMRLPYDSAFITTFTVSLSTPCLVFSSLTGLSLDGGQLMTMAWASLLCIALSAVFSVPFLLAFRLSLRTYLPALSFPNSGNLGLPVCLFAFGESGLGLGILFFAVFSITQFILGPAAAAGRFDLRQIVRTPVIYSVLLSLAVMIWGISLPKWITSTTALLGSCTVPIMLLSLGVALANLKMRNMVRAMALSVLRLAVGVGAGVLVAWMMGLSNPMRGVVILQSSMPVAIFNYLWALRYDNEPEEIAGMVIGSTGLAFLGLPVLLYVLM